MDQFRTTATAALGADPVGAYAFGDSPALADELLRLVLHGPKRATATAVADLERGDAPFPQAGQLWILQDGAASPACVIRTEEVRVAPLFSVDAGFAWEEGEGDRTRAWWLEAHEGFLRHQGVAEPESEPVLFERFRVVWPHGDEPHWWVPGVRELRGHEPAPDGPRPDLPGLALFDGERITGVLRFEPQPDELRLVSVQASDADGEARLRQAFALRGGADRGML